MEAGNIVFERAKPSRDTIYDIFANFEIWTTRENLCKLTSINSFNNVNSLQHKLTHSLSRLHHRSSHFRCSRETGYGETFCRRSHASFCLFFSSPLLHQLGFPTLAIRKPSGESFNLSSLLLWRSHGVNLGFGWITSAATVATDNLPPQIGATLSGWRSAIQGKMQAVKGNIQELNLPGKIQDLNLQGKVQELFNRDQGAGAAAEPIQVQSGGVLSKWNTYAATRPQTQGATATHGAQGRDLESGVPESLAPLLKSANSSLSSAYNSVTKGVQSATAGVQSATQFVPSRQAVTAFAIMIAAGSFFIFMAFFMFLPVIVLVPQKFAISFTIGSIFIVGSFFALKGPKAQFYHMVSKERLPFTAGFVGSMAATIYVSVVLHSYILSVVFAIIQVLALLYYLLSYFPGGTAGMQFLTSMIVSSFTKCFGRFTSS